MALPTISHRKPSWSSTLKTFASVYLWHVFTFPPAYTASYSRKHLQSHCREKLEIFQQCHWLCSPPKGRNTLSVKLSDFTVWSHTWRKNCVNCAVLTGNTADLRTVLSSRRSHRELRSSLRESHSFVFMHHSHTHKKTHTTDKKTDKPDGKPVLCQRIFSSVFRAVSLT
jgi:hypothetical protein